MLIDAKDEYLTPALVAARFKVSIPTVYRWMFPEDPAAPGEPTDWGEPEDRGARARGLSREGGEVAMWLLLTETPAEIPTHCPTCRPDLDPESYVLAWCGEHRPDLAGSGDGLVAIGQDYLGAVEAGGESNRLLCELLHRPAGGPTR